MAVTILNTDPGTYRPSVARGRSGSRSSARSALNAASAVSGFVMSVGVVVRVRRHREDLAGARVEHDDRAALVAERPGGGPLQVVATATASGPWGRTDRSRNLRNGSRSGSPARPDSSAS